MNRATYLDEDDGVGVKGYAARCLDEYDDLKERYEARIDIERIATAYYAFKRDYACVIDNSESFEFGESDGAIAVRQPITQEQPPASAKERAPPGGLLARYGGIKTPEAKKERKPVTEIPGLEHILRAYEKVLKKDHYVDEYIPLYRLPFLRILTPEEIDQVLQHTIQYEQHENYSWNTGLFFARLIQDSFNAGYNNFYLNMRSLAAEISAIHSLEGRADRIMCITINGNVGKGIGYCAKHAKFEIKGNADEECGKETENSTFTIHGNVGDQCAMEAKHSKFDIRGNAGELCGIWGKHLIMNIQGNAGLRVGHRTSNSRFYLHGSIEPPVGNFSEGNFQDKTETRNTIVVYSKESRKRVLKALKWRYIDRFFDVLDNPPDRKNFNRVKLVGPDGKVIRSDVR